MPLAFQGPGATQPVLFDDPGVLDQLAARLDATESSLAGILRAIAAGFPSTATHPYDSAAAFRDWIMDERSTYGCAVVRAGDGRYTFIIRHGAPKLPPQDKARFLLALTETIDGHLLVGAAFAAIGVLFHTGAVAEASAAAEQLDGRLEHFLLQMARHVTALAASGRPIPPHLQDVFGGPSRLADRFCPLPFTAMHVEADGCLYVCKSTFLNFQIASINDESAARAPSLPLTAAVRGSILDGSFRYCNRVACPKIVHGSLMKRSDAAKDPRFATILGDRSAAPPPIDRFVPYVPLLAQLGPDGPPITFSSLDELTRFADAVALVSPGSAQLLRALALDMRAASEDHSYAAVPFYEAWLASDDTSMVLTMGRLYAWTPEMPLLRLRRGAEDRSMGKIAFLILLNRLRTDAPFDLGTARALVGAVYSAARRLYARGAFAEARQIVNEQLSLRAHFLLEPAKRVLDLILAGRPVPRHLEDVLGESDYFKDKFCALPFNEVTIGVSGDTHICCPSYLNIPAGNIRGAEMADVLNSPNAQKVRASILDGSFTYCNRVACSFIAGDQLPTRAAARENPWLRRVIDESITRLDRVARMSIAIDQTCNLSCPSCRSSLIIEKGPELEWKMQAVRDTVMPMLKECETLQMAGYGEFAMSEPCRLILGEINERDYATLKLDLITNGLLFDKSFWARYPNAHNMINMVRVSVDGATKETYEKLRRGGKFEHLTKNMEFMAELRRAGKFRLGMLFVYQVENFREMTMMVEWAKRLGVDFLNFEKILDWSSFGTESGYRDAAVHLPMHPLNREFQDIIADPIFADPVVVRDWS